MIQLMRKDILTQRKTALIAPLFLILFLFEAEKDLNRSPVLYVMGFSLAIAFIGYMMVLFSNFSADGTEQNQNRLLLGLPVSRRKIVTAKYMMIIVWWLASYASFLVLYGVVARILLRQAQPFFDGRILLASLCLTYIFSSVAYPVAYRFGWKAAQMTGIFLFFGFSFGLGKLMKFANQTKEAAFIVQHPLTFCLVIAFVLTVVSYALSQYLYQSKDF